MRTKSALDRLPSISGGMVAAVALLGGVVGMPAADTAALGVGESSRRSFNQTASSPAPAKIHRYVAALFARYDADRNGELTPEEWEALRGQPARIDINEDARITPPEMVQHILSFAAGRSLGPPPPTPALDPLAGVADGPTVQQSDGARQPPTSTQYHVAPSLLSGTLPDWFVARDRNGDAQLSLAEFTPNVEASEVTQFERLDRNGDGLVTARELTRKTEDRNAAPQ